MSEPDSWPNLILKSELDTFNNQFFLKKIQLIFESKKLGSHI